MLNMTFLIILSVLILCTKCQAVPSVEDLIESYSYPVETHFVTTTDGYILRINRIPLLSNSKGVALLHHGLAGSSSDYLVMGPESSLACMLYDDGYDVWLLNDRGNMFSQNHTSYSTSSSTFWDYSWHEIGTIDVPQTIDYILAETGADDLYYVGFSQGTTTFYVMLSELPEYNSVIKLGVLLAPVVFMDKISSTTSQIISSLSSAINAVISTVGQFEMLKNGNAADETLYFSIGEFNVSHTDSSKEDDIKYWAPASCSSKQLLHYSQSIKSGYFRKYSYGSIGNYVRYGSLTPPNYDLDNINIPNYLFYSDDDAFSSDVNVLQLCNEIWNYCNLTKYNINHLDYLYATDAPTLVYERVIAILNENP